MSLMFAANLVKRFTYVPDIRIPQYCPESSLSEKQYLLYEPNQDSGTQQFNSTLSRLLVKRPKEAIITMYILSKALKSKEMFKHCSQIEEQASQIRQKRSV
ncbi:Hypothetical_protein [Hexamita inflata]|uniref:Hypothetical_protein n=1 Tax=Hexamita inflata TaxID=28002 RepID=A0AA86QCK3_9EUKA|nr:Hypothetical protein HINF_LOCUS43138 [Hexamita inflata]